MARPQTGIPSEPSSRALFLVLRLRNRARDGASAVRAASRVPALTAALAKQAPRDRLVSAVSFGPELWDVVSPAKRPKALRSFPALDVAGRSAPATGGDILLHTTARRADLCFELALRLRRELGDAAEVIEEVHGFRYLDARDLTGFIDGTENPKGRERAEAALVGREDPAFAGGSFVFTQRYVHDLGRWERLAVREQEAAIGRRKRDSRELADRAKPATAHIARVVIDDVVQRCLEQMRPQANAKQLALESEPPAQPLSIDVDEDEHDRLEQGLDDFADRDADEGRRVGKECVSSCRSRWSPDH